MRFEFTDEQQQLQDIARKFLLRHSDSAAVRRVAATERGWDPDVWRRVCEELGWAALGIPEAYGGYGFGAVEQAAIAEQIGLFNFCSPWLSTVVLGANVLVLGDTDHLAQAWLPAVAAGEKTLALGWLGDGRWDARSILATCAPDGDGWRINGTYHYVFDGHTADAVIVAARAPESHGTLGVSLFLIEPDATPGVERRWRPSMDVTRRLADVTLNDVRVGPEALIGELGGGWPVLAETFDVARALLAVEQVGGAEACLEQAVEYAKVRQQFGVPIGSFQAIKHKCADMMVQVESARSAAYFAAWTAAEDRDQLHEAALVAQAWCSRAFFDCAAENIQIHGGIGFTEEHDAHLYFKRARLSEQLFGAPAEHRRWFADAIGLDA
ncbi:MAG: acyl-CoA dehydrogenase, partial [Candidatus Dadabacteria bacterium]